VEWVLLAGVLLLAFRQSFLLRDRTRLLATQSRLREQESRERELLEQARQQLEEKVAERTRELRQAIDELSAFSYSVSHDLRAPLRSIDGFARLLHEDAGARLHPDEAAHLQRIRGATKRMGELIDALLRLAQVSRRELQKRRVNLSEVALEILEECQAREPTRKVEWNIEPDLWVWGDAGLLRQMLANLLENAWKYTGRRDQAHLHFGRDAQGQMYVRDDGVGFDMAHGRRLFEPFQRLHHSDDFPGHGVGLALVRRVLERHGGTIRVEAAPGAGAIFSFTLPPEGLRSD